MSNYYKVAIAIDKEDYGYIAEEVMEIEKVHKCDLKTERSTPENTYMCFLWEDVNHFYRAPLFKPLREVLDTIRHSLITIDEHGCVDEEFIESDSRGNDEEFYNLLSWDGCISFFNNDWPLEREETYIPISKYRLIRLLKSYISNDYEGMMGPDALYQALSDAGFEDEEIEVLGLDFCIPESEVTA